MIVYFHGNYKDFTGLELKGIFVFPRQCPQDACDGRLNKHGAYTRKTCVPRIARMRCTTCRRTVSLLPHFLAPYQRVITKIMEDIVEQWASGRVSGAWPKGWGAIGAPLAVG